MGVHQRFLSAPPSHDKHDTPVYQVKVGQVGNGQ